MSTHNIPFSIQTRKSPLNIPNLQLWDFSNGLKNGFETAVVNEPSVFEPLKFYCINPSHKWNAAYSTLFAFNLEISYCSCTRSAQPGPNRSLGPLRSDSVIRLVSVIFGKCTTLLVTKCWPMKTRLPCGDQWKAEKLGAFWRRPKTRCFIKSDRPGLIIKHSIYFRLNANIDGSISLDWL